MHLNFLHSSIQFCISVLRCRFRVIVYSPLGCCFTVHSQVQSGKFVVVILIVIEGRSATKEVQLHGFVYSLPCLDQDALNLNFGFFLQFSFSEFFDSIFVHVHVTVRYFIHVVVIHMFCSLSSTVNTWIAHLFLQHISATFFLPLCEPFQVLLTIVLA